MSDTPTMGEPGGDVPREQPGGAPPPPAPPPSGGPAPGPAAPQAGTGVGQPADLMTRFLAKLIDWVLVGVVIGVIIVPLTIGLAVSGAGFGGGFGFGGFSLGGIITNVVLYGLAVGYFAFLESNRGQTVGKMLLKLEVRGADGQYPSMEQALKRNAYMLLGIVPFLGGLAYLAATIYIAVTINNNATTRQGWHDEFAGGTSVIRIG
jgi:uncharacterized RDD family membrane protein YckC